MIEKPDNVTSLIKTKVETPVKYARMSVDQDTIDRNTLFVPIALMKAYQPWLEKYPGLKYITSVVSAQPLMGTVV